MPKRLPIKDRLLLISYVRFREKNPAFRVPGSRIIKTIILHTRGFTYQQIAKRLGYNSSDAVFLTIQKYREYKHWHGTAALRRIVNPFL